MTTRQNKWTFFMILSFFIICLQFIFLGIASAEFSEKSFYCYDENNKKLFTTGFFIQRDEYGNSLRETVRTDLSVDFAENLRQQHAFANGLGTLYIDIITMHYADTGHYVALVGGKPISYNGGVLIKAPTFFYVFKPQINGQVMLEIWKWKEIPHYGWYVIPGEDTLVLKKTFTNCHQGSLFQGVETCF